MVIFLLERYLIVDFQGKGCTMNPPPIHGETTHFSQTPTLEIVYAADDHYVVPLVAAISALVESQKSEPYEMRVTVLANQMSPSNVELIENLRTLGLSSENLRVLDISDRIPEGLPSRSPHNTYISQTAYARFLAPQLAQGSSDRILYLDADTLVKGSLEPLLTLPLGGRPAAAVCDRIIETVSHPQGLPNWRDLGLAPDAPYFNSGVLLMDCQLWRDEQIAERLYAYCFGRGDDLELFDQEALNAVLGREIVALDPEYNMFTNHLCNETVPGEAPLQRDPLSPEDIASARIVHYIGHLKPWKPGDTASIETDMFFEALDRTSLSGWRPTNVVTSSAGHE
ncbi:glycosyltransferase family 8 protein (plasmid) [Pseudarthrobacter sp. O4]|uniref:glycosyltransferase family 8 protein n=1 Tax=Pseudarthrobacter sp. O4 TaxID=3418417 RepID=UPI003CF7054A